jgi:hypothetical protein
LGLAGERGLHTPTASTRETTGSARAPAWSSPVHFGCHGSTECPRAKSGSSVETGDLDGVGVRRRCLRVGYPVLLLDSPVLNLGDLAGGLGTASWSKMSDGPRTLARQVRLRPQDLGDLACVGVLS